MKTSAPKTIQEINKDASKNKGISRKTKTKIFCEIQTIQLRTNLRNKDVMAALYPYFPVNNNHGPKCYVKIFV